MATDDPGSAWRAALDQAIRAAATSGPLAGLALMTDADMRFVIVQVIPEGWTYPYEDDPFFAIGDWPEHDGDASSLAELQSSWVDARYAEEDEDIGPDDDDERPWKQSLFRALTDALARCRDSGAVSADTLLLVYAPDPSEAQVEWMREGARRLNSPATFERIDQVLPR